MLEKKEDKTITKVTGLLDIRYGRSRTEKVEDVIEDLFKFREDDYEDDDALMLAMRDLRQRRIDLKMTLGASSLKELHPCAEVLKKSSTIKQIILSPKIGTNMSI